eukprot:3053172-Rhodomonas_salina.2
MSRSFLRDENLNSQTEKHPAPWWLGSRAKALLLPPLALPHRNLRRIHLNSKKGLRRRMKTQRVMPQSSSTSSNLSGSPSHNLCFVCHRLDVGLSSSILRGIPYVMSLLNICSSLTRHFLSSVPIRVFCCTWSSDLAENWNVDIARDLEIYLADLEILEISLDGGATTLNFAEAALLIQGTTCVYSRKVEYLHKLVFHVLEVLSDSQAQNNDGQKAADDGDNDDPEKAFPREPEFIALDDIAEAKSTQIDLADDKDDVSFGDEQRGSECCRRLLIRHAGSDTVCGGPRRLVVQPQSSTPAYVARSRPRQHRPEQGSAPALCCHALVRRSSPRVQIPASPRQKPATPPPWRAHSPPLAQVCALRYLLCRSHEG